MSLESLKERVFSVDVWSYGISLWEMFTLAKVPFQYERWDVEFIERLEAGIRLGRPKYCSPQMHVFQAISIS